MRKQDLGSTEAAQWLTQLPAPSLPPTQSEIERRSRKWKPTSGKIMLNQKLKRPTNAPRKSTSRSTRNRTLGLIDACVGACVEALVDTFRGRLCGLGEFTEQAAECSSPPGERA